MGVIDKHLTGQHYVESSVDIWVNLICEDALAALIALERPFKYVLHAIVVQNSGAGMHSALSELCDGSVDGTVIARWPIEKDKDKTNLLAVLTVYGVSI
jgi:hypothetical protein